MPRILELPVGIAVIVVLQLIVDQTMSQPRCDMLRVAQEYIAKRYPSFDPSGLKLVISEEGNFWQLTYELPEGMLGGAPIITIDKRTCTIVRAQHSQ
jgi:hypothetical protein